MLRIPSREINERFTTSELVFVAWRSQESADQLKKSVDTPSKTDDATVPRGAKTPTGLPKEFYNPEGELDLRQVTGRQALEYFKTLGITFPVMAR
jgi:hypothetical protein